MIGVVLGPIGPCPCVVLLEVMTLRRPGRGCADLTRLTSAVRPIGADNRVWCFVHVLGVPVNCDWVPTGLGYCCAIIIKHERIFTINLVTDVCWVSLLCSVTSVRLLQLSRYPAGISCVSPSPDVSCLACLMSNSVCLTFDIVCVCMPPPM